MTTPGITGTGASAAYPSATSSVDRNDQMGKDVFLKLLVAQMKYQDPSSPADSSQLMAQTATFSQVEQLEAIAKQNASLLSLQRAMSAGALVGHAVSYTDDTGQTQTGTVSSVVLGTDTTDAQVMVGGTAVPMGRITAISQPTG